MKKYIIFTISFMLLIPLAIFLASKKDDKLLSPVDKTALTQNEKPLEKYSFKNLKNRAYQGSQIKLDKILKQEEKFTSYLFFFTSDEKKVSGTANIPKGDGKFPVIVMLRGYINREKYTIGMGAKNSSESFARNGLLTLAPDFLGYGESASPSADVFEERFQKYTTVLNLIASLKSIKKADTNKIALWGHSNGGHLALSVLELTGKSYPTVLWAPVSKSFPYSILYYTDEYDDRGKLLRKALAEFELDYDIEKFNFTNYYDWINPKTPIQIHQGTDDGSVPLEWSDKLYKTLNNQKLDIIYYTYPNTDHNLSQNWQKVINRNILFYKQNLYL